MPSDPPVRFPPKTAPGPALVLRRRTPAPSSLTAGITAASEEARRSIDAIVSATRSPFGQTPPPVPPSEANHLEQALRQLETRLGEKENALAELEARLAEREREIAEMEALLSAREKVIAAARASGTKPASPLSAEEKTALEALRAELDRRENSLGELKRSLDLREKFIEENETRLFDKMQEQQEKENELEQKAEDLSQRAQRPPPAAEPKPASTKNWDEFRE